MKETQLLLDIIKGFNLEKKSKIVTICGSSRFVQIMAVCAWMIERDENKIVMGLHLLPSWYPDCPSDHLAEHEGVAEQMDELHFRKIDLSDEIFVVNYNGYIGESTAREFSYALEHNKKIRWFTSDPIGVVVDKIFKKELELCSFCNKLKSKHDPLCIYNR